MMIGVGMYGKNYEFIGIVFGELKDSLKLGDFSLFDLFF